MTTPSIGSATIRPTRGVTITIPSQITTSIHSLDSLTAAQLVPVPPPEPPSVIVYGAVTTVPDTPGFTIIPSPQVSSAAQISASRSGAANTAVAYGLDPIFWADTAAIEQRALHQEIARQRPTVIIEQIIIPP